MRGKRPKIVMTGGSGKLASFLLPVVAGGFNVFIYDREKPAGCQFECVQGDIQDLAKLSEAFHGADAVIHLAALRSRYNHLPNEVMRTNVLGTFCVLEAAREQRVRRFIFASSDAVLGFAQSRNEFAPEYLPVDEEHPRRPQDPYGISKFLGEEMCRCYAAGYGLEIAALRFSNILCPGDEGTYLADAADPSARRRFLWAWVHVEDAVQAIMKALSSNLSGYQVFHIAADDTCLFNADAGQLLATYYPDTPRRGPLRGRESLIDCSKAKQMLGYRPKRHFREVPTMQRPRPPQGGDR